MTCPTCHTLISSSYCKTCGTGKKEKKRKYIKRVSKKRELEEKRYSELRKIFLSCKVSCEVDGCRNPSEQVHHKKGRIGDLLCNVIYWLAVCHGCHEKIERNPRWAKKNKYSLSRTGK